MAAVQANLLTLQNALSVKDPALGGRWFTFVPDMAGNDVAINTVLVEHSKAVFYHTRAKHRPRAGTHVKFPDFADIEDVIMTFYENEDYDVTTWIDAWQKQVYDPSTGYYGLPLGPNGYRRDIVTYLFAKADETPVKILKYLGCWPNDRAGFELSYAELDGRLTVSANFCVTDLDLQTYGDS